MPVPYSDNLYSSNDIDDEDSALSPADGYFRASHPNDGDEQTANRVPNIPNVLVEDPTLTQGGGVDDDSKAREAEEEARLGNGQEETQSSSVSRPPNVPNHQHRRSVEEDDHGFYTQPGPASAANHTPASPPPAAAREAQPLLQQTRPLPLHPIDAPPAYSPSPTSPQSSHHGYQTFIPFCTPAPNNMGLLGEQQGLLSREPESMGGPPPNPPSYWQRLKDEWSYGSSRRTLKTALGVLVIMSVIAAILGGTLQHNPGRGKNGNKTPNDGIKDPVKLPPTSDEFQWKPLPGCRNTPYKVFTVTSPMEFDPKRNLTILEGIDQNDDARNGRKPQVTGEMFIQPNLDENDPKGRIILEVFSNDEDLSPRLRWDRKGFFETFTPKSIAWDHHDGGPCFQIRITVGIPKGAAMDRMLVGLTHLNIDLLKDTNLGTATSTLLSTVAGHISTDSGSRGKQQEPYVFNSREIYLETVSGDIGGSWPLYDLLKIRTASGDVDIDVGPKPVNKGAPKAAALNIESISGTVTVREPLGKVSDEEIFPSREYKTRVVSTSGDLDVLSAMTSEARVITQSGDIKTTLQPVLDTSLKAISSSAIPPSIKTDTKSGTTDVHVLEPKWTKIQRIDQVLPPSPPSVPSAPSRPGYDGPVGSDPWIIIYDRESADSSHAPALSLLESKHSSISGDITLRYPASWEGTFTAKTMTGSQTFGGDGLVVEKNGKGYFHDSGGYKGKGHSHLQMESMSGDEKFLVGSD